MSQRIMSSRLTYIEGGESNPGKLFNPDNHQRPRFILMARFIEAFFETHSEDFPFLSYQKVLADFWDDRLSDLLANCIAAMAVKSVFPFDFILHI